MDAKINIHLDSFTFIYGANKELLYTCQPDYDKCIIIWSDAGKLQAITYEFVEVFKHLSNKNWKVRSKM